MAAVAGNGITVTLLHERCVALHTHTHTHKVEFSGGISFNILLAKTFLNEKFLNRSWKPVMMSSLMCLESPQSVRSSVKTTWRQNPTHMCAHIVCVRTLAYAHTHTSEGTRLEGRELGISHPHMQTTRKLPPSTFHSFIRQSIVRLSLAGSVNILSEITGFREVNKRQGSNFLM